MRTTLDLPDPLFRRLKARAALDGVSLKDLIARFVVAGLEGADGGAGQVADPMAVVEQFVSAHDLMKAGCGIVHGGPPDLASNGKHMEGFGRE